MWIGGRLGSRINSLLAGFSGGQIVIVDWRDALPQEPDKLRPAVVVPETKRVPELLPIRYGRMIQSPFAFFRGAAALMATDLVGTPKTGFRVQACGDAHLLNFGGYGSPERSFGRVDVLLHEVPETAAKSKPATASANMVRSILVLLGRESCSPST